MTMRAAGSPTECVVAGKRVPDAETDEWVRALSTDGTERERAAAGLHELLLRVARRETRRRCDRLRISGPELDDLAHQAAADAVVAIIAKIAQALRRAVEEDLTEHQRRIFTAMVLDAVPLDVLAAELGSGRNAVYKTMFDARRKLRASLVASGYLHDNGVRHS